MARSDPQVNIRMPAHLKDKIEEATKSSGRSLNAEIVHRLDVSFANTSTSGSGGNEIALLKEMHQVALRMIDRQQEILGGKDQILRAVGAYLYEFSNIVPVPLAAREANRLNLVRQFALALAEDNMGDALARLLEIAEIQSISSAAGLPATSAEKVRKSK